MTNRGKYNRYITIYEIVQDGETNRLGEKIESEQVAAQLFASIETRVGGLLTGRPADTVMTNVTHKISWDYKNFPEILPDKHIIRYENHEFKVNYSINDGFKNEELQVFVTEKV
ncbi:MAG: hypothetical protein LUE64_06060 [Candidatus Gastranaerophilales bacterium]|nr:hypothetical protein [Candidatus Gastranaerophilales bacterium]